MGNKVWSGQPHHESHRHWVGEFKADPMCEHTAVEGHSWLAFGASGRPTLEVQVPSSDCAARYPLKTA
jgi:hypothetical protein